MKAGDLLKVKVGEGDTATKSGNGIECGDIVAMLYDGGGTIHFKRKDGTKGNAFHHRFDLHEEAPYAEGAKVKITDSWSSFHKGAVFTVANMFKSDNDGTWYASFVEKLIELPTHNLNTGRFKAYTPPTGKVRRVPMAHANTQLSKVLKLTQGNGAFTLATIAELTGASEAAASARLRDLRANGYIVTCTKPKGDKQRVYTVETAAVAA